MGCENYRQYDSRWAAKSYAGENMAAAGCGPTAVANVVHQLPSTVAGWLTTHGYACYKKGTMWYGITDALNAYGYGGQQLNGSSLYGTTGSSAEHTWKNAMATGTCYGILLMGPGVFTGGGHYITITQYDGSRCYVHDPASAARDGWHPWSDFAGCVKVFYLADKKDCSDTKSGTTIAFQKATASNQYCFSLSQIDVGAAGVYVLLLQEILTARGYDTGGLDRSYGKKTEAAVLAYQKTRGCLANDGSCGMATWADLLALPKASGAFVVKQVKAGDRSVEVLLLQEILKARGYYAGGLDWNFGPQTSAALKKYQTERGLKIDGVAGPQTWRDLIAL